MSDPDILEVICCHVANGGTMIDLAETWGVVFGDLSNWIHSSPEREKRYVKALNDRGEWGVETILRELRRIALFDIRLMYREDGSVKPPSEWPKEIAAVVANLEVSELHEGSGKERAQVGETKKIKFFDKLRALELLGKNMALFIDRHEHTVVAKLEDLVIGSQTVVIGEKE